MDAVAEALDGPQAWQPLDAGWASMDLDDEPGSASASRSVRSALHIVLHVPHLLCVPIPTWLSRCALLSRPDLLVRQGHYNQVQGACMCGHAHCSYCAGR